MFPRKRNASGLRIETLEQRMLLAGNITGQLLEGGVWRLTGNDSQDKTIVIVGDATPGHFTLQALPQQSLSASYVKPPKMVTPLQEVSGVTAIEIHLKAGDDVVTLENVHVAGGITIEARRGADQVTLTDVSAASLDVDAGIYLGRYGNDRITLSDVHVGGNMRLVSGAGDDTFEATHVSARTLTLNSRYGNDRLLLDDVHVAKKVKLIGGENNDQLTVIDSVFQQDLKVLLRGGNDAFDFRSNTVSGTALLDGEGGVDGLNPDVLDANRGALVIRNFEVTLPAPV